MKEKSNKNKVIIWIILALVALGIGIFVWNIYFVTPYSNNNYEAERTAYNENSNDEENTQNENEPQEEQAPPTETEQQTPPPTSTIVEEGISEFSTKIFSKDAARQNNINITCSKLNDTIVKNGETFSFCNTVGPATSAAGYQKADIFDANGKKKKGLGGGNCQISTTLYNAVLAVPNLNITERHQHSNYVPYIQRGKDAAVAYGSYDLKFVNQTGSDIKIKATTNSAIVNIAIYKLTAS